MKMAEGCADKKVVWSKQVEWELVGNGTILLASWSESCVCDSGREIA